jgi:CRP-like cAMP-binding protein
MMTPTHETHLLMTAHRLMHGLKFDEVAACARQIVVTRVERGETIFHRGDPADSVYFLLEGIVKKTFINPAGDEKTISIYQSGDLFGALFLGKYTHRIGTAIALEDSLTGRLRRDHLQVLIGQFPLLGLNFIGYLADEQRETLARLHALQHVDARHRLLGTLLSLSRRYCCQAEGWVHLPASITQDDLASITCLNRSTVNVHLNQLREQGILGGKGRQLLIDQQAVERELERAGLEILE